MTNAYCLSLLLLLLLCAGDLSLGSADGQQRQVGAGLLPSMISEVARRIRSLYS